LKTREEIQEWYDSHSHYGNAEVRADWGRIHWFLPYIKGETLEVGSSHGGVTKIVAALPQVSSVLAIDITDASIERTTTAVLGVALSKVTVMKTWVEDLSDNLRFDTILLFEVLEHLLDDRAILQKCVGMLRPGGSILISTPYEARFVEPDHLHYYDTYKMDNLMQSTGLPYWIATCVSALPEYLPDTRVPVHIWFICKATKEEQD
jgi:2-polyprenyl-6-hydroxyphenyl methylase/3-demethylubiquinone-9 3-methyltransferase